MCNCLPAGINNVIIFKNNTLRIQGLFVAGVFGSCYRGLLVLYYLGLFVLDVIQHLLITSS